MNKNTFIAIIIILLSVLLASVVLWGSNDDGKSIKTVQNVEVKDGVQYVTIDARGGYFPKESSIKPNMPTKLIIKTNNTYDCSASLVVRSVNFQKMLKPTGEEIIDLGTLKSGEDINGVCGMGMYSFKVKAG
jgi:plastocyanin domain-containing protein